MHKHGKLFSFEFTALCVIIATAFCNISTFYSFYHYLGVIEIPVIWRGFLVGLEPMAAFVLRLFVLPWLHLRNALFIMALSIVMLIAVSCSYLWVVTVPGMIVLRVVHGAVFVLLTASVIALAVHFIPPAKSGQGFSLLAVATMLPYAVIPPLSEFLLPYLRNEADIYAGVTIFSVLALVLLFGLHGRLRRALAGVDGELLRRLTLEEIRNNFRVGAVNKLLVSIFLVYMVHAAFFYFMKDLTLETAGGNTGLFFMICMLTMIAVRAGAGAYFDSMDKRRLLRAGLATLIFCALLIPNAHVAVSYYAVAVIYGAGMGTVLPLLNSLLFTVSPPQLRGFNTNLTLFSLDAAYFMMPYLGGILLTLGMGFGSLFYMGAGFVIVSMIISAPPRPKKKPVS